MLLGGHCIPTGCRNRGPCKTDSAYTWENGKKAPVETYFLNGIDSTDGWCVKSSGFCTDYGVPDILSNQCPSGESYAFGQCWTRKNIPARNGCRIGYKCTAQTTFCNGGSGNMKCNCGKVGESKCVRCTASDDCPTEKNILDWSKDRYGEVADACTSGAGGQPCLNGGSATGTGSDCSCTCSEAYEGDHCEEEKKCTVAANGLCSKTITTFIAANISTNLPALLAMI